MITKENLQEIEKMIHQVLDQREMMSQNGTGLVSPAKPVAHKDHLDRAAMEICNHISSFQEEESFELLDMVRKGMAQRWHDINVGVGLDAQSQIERSGRLGKAQERAFGPLDLPVANNSR
jgi:hypothetical protein